MRTATATLACSLLLLASVSALYAMPQDDVKPEQSAKAVEPPPHFYNLAFVVQELDAGGKPVNSRSYTTTVSTDRHFTGSIRTGSRIPIATGSYESSESKGSVNTQFQYIDVGVDLDLAHVVEIGGELSFDLSAEISSIADARDPNLHQPVIRQNRWHAPVLVPIGKATVLFNSDSLDSKGSMQVSVTATPIP